MQKTYFPFFSLFSSLPLIFKFFGFLWDFSFFCGIFHFFVGFVEFVANPTGSPARDYYWNPAVEIPEIPEIPSQRNFIWFSKIP